MVVSSEVIDIFPRNLDSSLCFIKTSILYDVLRMTVKVKVAQL